MPATPPESARSAADVRRQFIDFFIHKHGHAFVPSSPVVPHADPTLLFANAGMNQFKPYFLGTERPEHTRVANTQKCIRAGGKHNDLEDVGRDTYHHTFFEMLGNWSFGDYFKEEAIDWAWELLVDVWGIDRERLHATYFRGDESEGLAADDEARELWRKYLPDERIHPGSKKDNFWEMGDTGPCGPCSELHYDGTPDLSGGGRVNADDPNVIEIWNLVFIQFNRDASGTLRPLPAKHVDTGMGFERIVRVLDGKSSNYDTDVFTPLFDAIREATGARAYGGELEDATDTAYRVIADHVRCLTFALTDGAEPSNEGRGYVLRRILRRAARYGRQTLGVDGPFLYRLVDAVVEHMGEAFPELREKPERVTAIIRDEEESFGKTLDRGIQLFEQAAADAIYTAKAEEREGALAQPIVTDRDAFTLYDTYGFPLDLTQLMAEERGLSVDVEGFERLMAVARQRSRGTAGGDFDVKAALTEIVQQHGGEGGDLPATRFIGYDRTEGPATSQPLRIFRRAHHGFERVERAMVGDHVAVVVEETPFYAESGGQVGDRGAIVVGDAHASGGGGGRVEVEDTLRVGEHTFHLGEVSGGTIQAGEHGSVALAVDATRRRPTMAHHTATHLLNRALRRHVNPRADQRGSLVDPDRLRFDFSHDASLTHEQVEAVEREVRADIEADLPVDWQEADQERARGIRGLRAVFGEKYPTRVRVVSVGRSVDQLLASPEDEGNERWSIEFCGGTHLRRTGEADTFCITSEEGVARGVRRVTALAGEPARRAQREGAELWRRLEKVRDSAGDDAERLRNSVNDLQRRMSEATIPATHRVSLNEGLSELQAKLRTLEKQQAQQSAAGVVDEARAVADAGDDTIITARFDADANALRTAMDVIRKKRPDAALMLAGVSDGKVSLIAAVPDPLITRGLKAGDWIREVARVVGGGGGGRPEMAQAGGKDPQRVDEALEAARVFAAGKV